MNDTLKKTKGFTLIELMVSILIGLFLLAGLVQIFFASKQTYRLGDGLSRLQENGRFAQYEINRMVRLAGYKPDPTVLDNQVFLADSSFALGSTGLPLVGEQVIMGVDDHSGSDDIIPGTDVLTVRYMGTSDNKTTDCAGIAVTATITSLNTFYVKDGNSLFCTAKTGSSAEATQELISGIEDLQFLYGVDSSGDDVVDQYMDADSVTSSTNWPNVISVRVGLLVNTINDVLTEQDTKPHDVIPVSATIAGNPITANDRLRRQVFSSTVQLRNKTK